MINAATTWQTLLHRAKLYEAKKEVFYSKTGSRYLITSTANETIRIVRLDTNPRTHETIGIRKYATCVDRINRNLRGTGQPLYDHVVEGATLLELIPTILASNADQQIVPAPPLLDLPEAASVDPSQRIAVYLLIRSQQLKMKQKLLSIYKGKCCISSCAIRPLLHACHIVPFAQSGNNLSTNGLLLRSDLHDLFDANLLAIHPETLQVFIHTSITDVIYRYWHGKYLSERTDDHRPDQAALTLRWKLYNNR